MATLVSNPLKDQTFIDIKPINGDNNLEQLLQKLKDNRTAEIPKTSKTPADEIDSLIPKFDKNWQDVKELLNNRPGESVVIQNLRKEIKKLKAQNEDLKEKNTALEKNNKDLEVKNNDLEEENTVLKKDLRGSNEFNIQLGEIITKQKERIDVLEPENTTLKSDLTTLQGKILGEAEILRLLGTPPAVETTT